MVLSLITQSKDVLAAGLVGSRAIPRRQGSRGNQQLLSVIYQNVIPQLGSAHQVHDVNASDTSSSSGSGAKSGSLGSALSSPAVISPSGELATADVVALADLLIKSNLAGARQLLIERRLSGMSLAAINLNLLAPTARYLGVLWERDKCDFNAVTLTVSNLQSLMRELEKLANDNNEQQGHHHRALLAPVEGEDHTFGLSMLGDFFGRDGWDVWGGPGLTEEGLLSLASTQSFDIAGLSIADERWLDRAESTIVSLRSASDNPHLKIIIGGPLLAAQPELAKQLGADATASTAPDALLLANKLVSASAIATLKR